LGEVTLEERLAKENPRARAIDLRVFADALRAYDEASENIARNGVIVQHPRTGTPIDNPYLKVRAQQAAILNKLGRIKCSFRRSDDGKATAD
jgi:hypothetical protein